MMMSDLDDQDPKLIEVYDALAEYCNEKVCEGCYFCDGDGCIFPAEPYGWWKKWKEKHKK